MGEPYAGQSSARGALGPAAFFLEVDDLPEQRSPGGIPGHQHIGFWRDDGRVTLWFFTGW